jgi:TPP-dependent pyruvate/acetoin dehydrogenase alpha subunit
MRQSISVLQQRPQQEWPMEPDLWQLYRTTLKNRLFEEAIIELWNQGKISGELAAVALEAGISLTYGRVCTDDTIPYSRQTVRYYTVQYNEHSRGSCQADA